MGGGAEEEQTRGVAKGLQVIASCSSTLLAFRCSIDFELKLICLMIQ